jgi:hypothetical protein
MNTWLKPIIVGVVGVGSTALFADQMHYRNVIIGERAQGMGGAYVGVSDDASGVFYNPAGIAFAQSNDISGSANAIYSKKVTYKNAILGTSDWTEESSGTFAPFFGVMQKLDKYLPGLVGGFAYYTLDTELKDQNNTITDTGDIAKYHRSANQRASTYAATTAVGYRISPSLGLGLSIGYLQIGELNQISQSLVTKQKQIYQISSARESLQAYGMQLGLGIQYAPTPKVALGLTLRTGTYASQKYNVVMDNLTYVGQSKAASVDNTRDTANKNPLGSMPLEVRGGVAWFASTRFLMTTDIEWHDKVTDEDSSMRLIYQKDAVLNYALGTEYYVTPSTPLRLGYFTNNDASPKITSSSANQADHVDYQGLSIFGAWAQPNSQVSLGAVLQSGKGKAQKLGGSDQQDVSAFAYTLGFSATHNL